MKDKIPFYNIINMFFVGSVFTFISAVLFHDHFMPIDLTSPIFAILKDWSVIISAILLMAMYEIGFILNRVSSVLIGSLLEKIRIWPKYQYDKDVSEIAEKNARFQSMVTDLVLMRTHILLYLIVAVLSLFSSYKWFTIVCGVLIVLFVFAGKKHNSKINKLRESYAETAEKADKRNEEVQKYLTYNGKSEGDKNDT